MRLVITPTLEIAVEESGPQDGLPVLLLHGWPDAPRGWLPVAERLNELGWRTIVPALRGSGETRFRSDSSVRDGRGVALTADAVELLDAMGLERVAVVGHDWGARAAYGLAALAPERVSAIAAIALAYQPRNTFTVPDWDQCQAHWYQWLMHVDAGADAVARDPIGFARTQWQTWSPAGWFTEAEFETTATSFSNPDWVRVTLNAYRHRFLNDEPCDPAYDELATRLGEIEQIHVPTVMVQGEADTCDVPASSADLDRHFTAGYQRVLLAGIGHFPHREAPAEVSKIVDRHLASH